MKFIIQNGSFGLDREKTQVLYTYSDVEKASLGDLSTPEYKSLLKGRVPIGSVEFVKEIMRVRGIAVPSQISYPSSLAGYLNREVVLKTFKAAKSHEFIKPAKQIKAFTGAIKANIEEPVDDNIPVLASNPITFLAEWRAYVLDGAILGASRYDDSDDEYPLDKALLEQMVQDYADAPVGYSLDVGLTDKNETILVEVNDGWSLGWYPWGDVIFQDYLKLIAARWSEIEKKP